MATMRICDGRPFFYQWDTGAEIELCECDTVTEVHFATPNGTIKRDVTDNVCSVPDVALQTAGTLTAYAFLRDASGGITRHEMRINVIARPKPADYIDPPDELDNLEALAERVAGIAKETDPTVPAWAKQPEKPTYTAEEVGAQPKGDYALKGDIPEIPEIPAPYVLPVATADTLGGVKVGDGLTVDQTGVLGVKPEPEFELITTLVTDEPTSEIVLDEEPNGAPFDYRALQISVTLDSTVVDYSNSAYVIFTDGPATGHREIMRLPAQGLINNGVYTARVVAFAAYGRWYAFCFGSATRNNKSAIAVSNVPGQNGNASTREFTTLRGVRIVLSSAAVPSGTTVEIEGVRA